MDDQHIRHGKIEVNNVLDELVAVIVSLGDRYTRKWR